MKAPRWQRHIILIAFLLNTFGPRPCVYPQSIPDVGVRLSAPGVMVRLSPEFNPPILKGIKVHPDNPFRFDFILDQGDSPSFFKEGVGGSLKQESAKLIKYFLASLTIPEKDLWVNLSPYEKDRIIPSSFGLTEMGRDLLAEDYMLKQITASLIYPEDKVGKEFWKRIYEETGKKYGTTNVAVNTFNKVWIVPQKAVVYENAKAGTAYVVEAKLKVMLEEDYLALAKKIATLPAVARNDTSSLGSQVLRAIVIPQLTKEVNEGKNFATLRQVYNALILAAWYKKKIKDSILAQVYADKNKVKGIEYSSSVIASEAKQSFNKIATSPSAPRNDTDVELIYHRYLQAFKKGVYNYIKEDVDPLTKEAIPRKYFSGGVALGFRDSAMDTNLSSAAVLEIKHTGIPDNAQISQLRDLTIDMAMSTATGVQASLNLGGPFILDQGQYPLWKTHAALYVLSSSLNDEDEHVRGEAQKQIRSVVTRNAGLERELSGIPIGVFEGVTGNGHQQEIQEIVKDEDEMRHFVTVLRGINRWRIYQRIVRMIQNTAQQRGELLNVPGIMEALITRLKDKDSSPAHQAIAGAIAAIAKYKIELLNTDEMTPLLMACLKDKDYFQAHRALAEAMGTIVEKKPELAKKIMEDLLSSLTHKDWEVRRAGILAISSIVERAPRSLDTNQILEVLISTLIRDSHHAVRQAAVEAIGKILTMQNLDGPFIQSIFNFIGDQDKGFGLKQTDRIKAMNLLYAFAELNDPQAMELFLSILRPLDQEQRSVLADIAYHYFKSDAFVRFIDVLRFNRQQGYHALIENFQTDFMKLIKLDRDIEGRILNGWEGVKRLLSVAGRYEFLQERILTKIIITLRLLRQGAIKDTEFQKMSLSLQFGKLNKDLIRLLEDKNIPLYVKRRLLQSLPLGNQQDVDLLRGRASGLTEAVLGADKREGLVGKIVDALHKDASNQNLLLVETYKIFVESNGRDQEAHDRLERMLGYPIDTVANRVPETLKEKTLKACDDLIEILTLIYGGGSLEMIESSMHAAIWGLKPEQREKISSNFGRINLLKRKGTYALEDLQTVIDIRQDVHDVIKQSRGEALYYTFELDRGLELLVYKIFTSIDEEGKNNSTAVLLMLKNSRFNGYEGPLLDRLIQELESFYNDPSSPRKYRRIYAIVQKTQKWIKDILGAIIEDYQQTAEQIEASSGTTEQDHVWVEKFSSNIFRADNLYLLDLLTNNLKKKMIKKLGLTGWQVVVHGTMSGQVHYVRNETELKNVRPDEILVMDRLPEEQVHVAGIIVFKEDSLGAHPAVLARQNGIPVIVCPDEKLIAKYYGKEITLTMKGDGAPDIQKRLPESQIPVRTRRPIQVPHPNLNSPVYLLPKDYTANTVGQKGFNLGEKEERLPLAEGQRRAAHVALSFAFYQKILQDPSNEKEKGDINAIVSSLVAGEVPPEQLAEKLAQMRQEIESLHIPAEILEQTRAFIRQQIPKGLVYLRSSTNAEDLPHYAGAGLYDSFGAIDPDKPEQLEAYIKKVWASVWNDRAYKDRQRNGIDHFGVHMAVLVHEMADAQYSYVIHTVNPSNNNQDEMMIEIIQGFGEALVSGKEEYEGAPYRFVYNKINGAIRMESFADKNWKLVIRNGRLVKELTDFSDDIFIKEDEEQVKGLLRALFNQAKGIQKLFGDKPQDIEGCLVLRTDDLNPRALITQLEKAVGKDQDALARIARAIFKARQDPSGEALKGIKRSLADHFANIKEINQDASVGNWLVGEKIARAENPEATDGEIRDQARLYFEDLQRSNFDDANEKAAERILQALEARAQKLGLVMVSGTSQEERANKLDFVFVQSRDQQLGHLDHAMLVGAWDQAAVVPISANRLSTPTGGIDLTPANMNLETKMPANLSDWRGLASSAGGDSRLRGNDSVKGGNDNGGIKFYLDPAMLKQLQKSPGFIPIIVNIQPLVSLKDFLESLLPNPPHGGGGNHSL